MNEQLNIFSVFRRDFRINNKIRLIELFAGVGSQAIALKRLGADFEHYKVVEFDKYAIKSYNAIHDFNPHSRKGSDSFLPVKRVLANELLYKT